MTERRGPTPEDVNRQVRQHLDSLRAAGVEWLPATGPAPAVPAAAAPPPEPAVPAASLFDPAPEAPPAAAPLEQRRPEFARLGEPVPAGTGLGEFGAPRTLEGVRVGPV